MSWGGSHPKFKALISMWQLMVLELSLPTVQILLEINAKQQNSEPRTFIHRTIKRGVLNSIKTKFTTNVFRNKIFLFLIWEKDQLKIRENLSLQKIKPGRRFYQTAFVRIQKQQSLLRNFIKSNFWKLSQQIILKIRGRNVKTKTMSQYKTIGQP